MHLRLYACPRECLASLETNRLLVLLRLRPAAFECQMQPKQSVLDELIDILTFLIDARSLLHPLRCKKKATQVQAQMKEEDGIQGAADHIHTTVYGMLAEGKVAKWMRTGNVKKV